MFFTASGRSTADELSLFVEEVASSNLPGRAVFRGVQVTSWDAALRLLASAVPDSGSVIVIDELPYLTRSDPGFEGTLQKLFDRELSRRRVLLVGVGSDLAMMETLNAYGRPFHQRATEMVVPPLSPAEVGEMLKLGAVLSAVGSGERTFTTIGRAAGDIPQGSLNRSLKVLLDKRVLEQDQPLSLRPGAKDAGADTLRRR